MVGTVTKRSNTEEKCVQLQICKDFPLYFFLFFIEREFVHIWGITPHRQEKQDHMAPTAIDIDGNYHFFLHPRGEGILMKVKYVPYDVSALRFGVVV